MDGPVFIPSSRMSNGTGTIVSRCKDHMSFRPRYRDEELGFRRIRVPPKEFFFDAQHDDVFELKALAFVDGEKADRIRL